MSFQDQPTEQLADVRHIKEMMERSSRFLSLSGFSGIAAGVCALAGAWIARGIIIRFEQGSQRFPVDMNLEKFMLAYNDLRLKLILLAIIVFLAALGSAFYFTWRRTRKLGTGLWNVTSRRLFRNVAIPILAGAAFVLGMLWHDEWRFVAAASLIFYGLALINASKYTLTDIRFLGFSEVLLGLASMFFPFGYALYFWAIGFGALHILYGVIMWYRYERKGA